MGCIPRQGFYCRPCGKRFARKHDTKRHVQVTLRDQVAAFSEHVKVARVPPQRFHVADAGSRVPCHLCGADFATDHVRQQHYRLKHGVSLSVAEMKRMDEEQQQQEGGGPEPSDP